MSETRIPTQKRSVEKRKRIIEKGFELMCNKGFYNTNTNEIARYADVSTGIIYQYFKDKKEIFLEGVKNYSDQILFPALNALEGEAITPDRFEALISMLIDNFIKTHTISKKAHEELMAMSHLDEDVAAVFKQYEFMMTQKFVELLQKNHVIIANANEKIHILCSMVDQFCHEIVYHQHKELDYDIMKDFVVHVIVHTLQ